MSEALWFGTKATMACTKVLTWEETVKGIMDGSAGFVQSVGNSHENPISKRQEKKMSR